MADETAEPQATRAEIYRIIADAIDAGLPAPRTVDFYDTTAFDLTLDSGAGREAWEPIFGIDPEKVHSQPYPHNVLPEQFEHWTTTNWNVWRGWHVNLRGRDPITDDHKRQWVESGGAARHPVKSNGGEPS